MSLEEAWSWQVKVYHSAVARGDEELLEVQVELLVFGYVQMNPFMKAA